MPLPLELIGLEGHGVSRGSAGKPNDGSGRGNNDGARMFDGDLAETRICSVSAEKSQP